MFFRFLRAQEVKPSFSLDTAFIRCYITFSNKQTGKGVKMLSKALSIVAAAFEGKTDKGGQPYFLHCLWVMNKMDQSDHELMSIAVMHDLVEDTSYTLDDLREMGFSDRVVWGIQALTHEEGVPYMDYIKQISFNEDARKVKMADLRHNSDIMRMKGLRKKDFARLEKYHMAYEYLKD